MTDRYQTRRTAAKIEAFGDPRRRAIIEILSRGKSFSVADLARRLPVTRPAVSQHLRVLADAGLVTHRKEGTRHIYQLDPEGMAALRSYLDELWQRTFANFKMAVEQPYRQMEKGNDHAQRRKNERE
jgi:DNA-binding transcriptional ArsR family regulator